MTHAIDWLALRAAAEAQLAHAYAPYSRFQVAAALLCEDGSVITGVNVENASYGLTVCAERNAIGTAIGRGVRRVLGMVVVCSADAPAPPCGACRQVLCEFPPPFPLRCYGRGADELTTTSDALLPHAFGPGNVAPRKR